MIRRVAAGPGHEEEKKAAQNHDDADKQEASAPGVRALVEIHCKDGENTGGSLSAEVRM